MTLGRQMYSGKVPYFVEKFEESTSKPFEYLLLDLKPTTPESNRLLSNVLQQQTPKSTYVIPTSNVIKTDQHLAIPFSYVGDHSKQMYESMSYCDDCGVVLDSMHGLQRHIKQWCPEKESFKRKSDDEDLNDEKPSVKSNPKWNEYDSDSNNSREDGNIDKKEGYKTILNTAIGTTKDILEKKHDKSMKEGMNKDDAVEQCNSKVTPLVQSRTSGGKKNRDQFNELFDEDYFEMNSENDDNDDDDEEGDTSETEEEKD
ncbi:unnamed protein product [Mytilus coruscus]|uniref:Uncharacterized protein n=1 Tax=Mytilus coruscus TaxID=42192 RepID=A0A6J8DU33_MYTCO|nr:unnamed protein product [Mytilus coruscus]